MALTAISQPQIITGAMGQYSKVQCQFNSTQSLAGKDVQLWTSLFSSNNTPFTNNNAWQTPYPAIGSTAQFNYVGSNVNENWQATITAIDDMNFTVCYEFFWLSDINGVIGNQSYSNYNIFNPSNGLGGSVYSQQDTLGLTVQTCGEMATCNIPAEGNSFCVNQVDFDLGVNCGFKPNEDYQIKITIPGQGISGSFYAGFIQEDGVSNNQNYINAYNLNYGLVNNGVTPITPNGSQTVPVSCLKTGQAFNYNGTNSCGYVTIDGSCLMAGSEYRLYVVYKENGEWKSCISPVITQGANQRSIIEALMSCCVTDVCGVQYTDCCLKGVAKCGTLNICFKFDRATFETNLAAAGYTQSLDDLFENSNIYLTGLAPQNENSIGNTIPSNFTIDATGVTVCANYTPKSNDNRLYFTGCFQLNYGTATNPDRDNYYIHTDIQFSTIEIEATPEILLDGNPSDSIICEGLDAVLSWDIPDATKFFIDNGLGLSQLDSNTINCNQLESDVLNRVKAICSNPCPPEEICPCPTGADCPDTVLNIYSEYDVNSNDAIFEFTSEAGSILTINDQTINGNTIDFGGQGQGDFAWSAVITKDGCTWTETGVIVFDANNPEQTSDIIITGTQADCDCLEECGITRLWVDYNCDESTGDITFTPQQEIDPNATITSDTGWITNEETNGDCKTVYINRRIEIEGCTPVELDEVLECCKTIIVDPPDPIDPTACDYSDYGLTCTKDEENCTFDLQVTGDESELIRNEKKYCLDGNKEVQYNGSPVYGQGSFVALWTIQKEGCEPITLNSGCYIKPKIQLEALEINVNAKNCDCECLFTARCVNCILYLDVMKKCIGYCFVWKADVPLFEAEPGVYVNEYIGQGPLGVNPAYHHDSEPINYTITAMNEECDCCEDIETPFVQYAIPSAGTHTGDGTIEV